MARRALATIALATALLAPGCALDDEGPAAGRTTPPLITHPSQRPDGTPARPGTDRSTPPPGPCLEAADVTAALIDGEPPGPAVPARPPSGAHPTSSVADVQPVQIVPRCSELEVPVPFTVPDGARGPGSV